MGCPFCTTVLVLIVAIIFYVIYKICKRPRKSPLKTDFEKGMVYLYQFGRIKGLANYSPFCLKLETWLRMADIKYEVPKCSIMTRSSEGTLPFLEYNGQEYPDSTFAIRDMTEIFEKESMDGGLTAEQRSIGRAFEQMVENSFFVALEYLNLTEHPDEFIQLAATNFNQRLAPVLSWIAKIIFIPTALKNLKKTYVGKHSRSEILNISRDDLRAISEYLGTKKFFFGNQPTKIDATLFGTLAQVVYSPIDIPQKHFVEEELTNLKDYCDRMKERYWPDWDEITNVN